MKRDIELYYKWYYKLMRLKFKGVRCAHSKLRTVLTDSNKTIFHTADEELGIFKISLM